jgi:biopolymer transport protein ExbD
MLSHRRERTSIEPNLTSLIDVTFLLIVFFVLVSRLNEIENIEVKLPSPKDAATALVESEQQVVISVMPAPTGTGQVSGYRVGVNDFAADAKGVEAMAAHLAALYQVNPALNINLRADRATHYEHVEPVVQAVALAARAATAAGKNPEGIGHINLAVVKE